MSASDDSDHRRDPGGSGGSLSQRIRLPGRNDEFRELADSFDTMLAQLEAHVAEQRRFAANASHEQRLTERVHADHAGAGLGLAIVASITEAHDGTLTLTPRPSGGRRVTVQLPAAPPDGVASPAGREW